MAFIPFCLHLSNGKFWLGPSYTVEFHLLIHNFTRHRVKVFIVKISKEIGKKTGKRQQMKKVHETLLAYGAMKRIDLKIEYDINPKECK